MLIVIPIQYYEDFNNFYSVEQKFGWVCCVIPSQVPVSGKDTDANIGFLFTSQRLNIPDSPKMVVVFEQ